MPPLVPKAGVFSLLSQNCYKYNFLLLADVFIISLPHSRNLAGEIIQLYGIRTEAGDNVDDLMELVSHIIPYHMTHNAEHEACDLLMEVNRIPDIVNYADAKNYNRVCLYLISCASYVAEPEDSIILRVATDIYRKVGKHADATRMALRLNNQELISEIFASCED